jgi:hypothetical protein
MHFHTMEKVRFFWLINAPATPIIGVPPLFSIFENGGGWEGVNNLMLMDAEFYGHA